MAIEYPKLDNMGIRTNQQVNKANVLYLRLLPLPPSLGTYLGYPERVENNRVAGGKEASVHRSRRFDSHYFRSAFAHARVSRTKRRP